MRKSGNNKKKYDNIYKKSLILFFLIFICSIFIFNLFSKDVEFSEEENRNLASKPEFSLQHLFQNKFTSKFEKYVSDQFIFRDDWINIKSHVERLLGKKENNGIYICSNDYLISKFQKPSTEAFKEKLDTINTFCENNKNVSRYVMLVPNKISILSDKLPFSTPTKDQNEYITKFYSGLNEGIKNVNVYDTLNENKDKYIYYKTDHHWTTEGAYYAYLEYCKQAGLKPKELSTYDNLEVTRDFDGTLYSKSGIRNISADKINIYLPKEKDTLVVNYIDENKKSPSLYVSEKLKTKDKYAVFLGGNHSLIKIDTLNTNNKNLLVIKDSYANSFIPFLASHYSTITIVDPRYYSSNIHSLIKDYNITDVLFLYNTNTFFEDDSILFINDEA